jgi:BirA family biotin operon repressor/biotin-[acetyl-CoA-carboxylase] ligase
VGVATIETLQRLGAPGLALKWPNDIVHSQGKVGGILLELQQQGSARWLILGLGLNVLPLPAAPDQALGLRALGLRVSREAMLEALFPALLAELRAFLREGLGPALRQRYQALDAYQGAFVQAEMGNDRIQGHYRGINEEGLLVLETASGLKILGHGEVSLRRLEGGQARYV